MRKNVEIIFLELGLRMLVKAVGPAFSGLGGLRGGCGPAPVTLGGLERFGPLAYANSGLEAGVPCTGWRVDYASVAPDVHVICHTS